MILLGPEYLLVELYEVVVSSASEIWSPVVYSQLLNLSRSWWLKIHSGWLIWGIKSALQPLIASRMSLVISAASVFAAERGGELPRSGENPRASKSHLYSRLFSVGRRGGRQQYNGDVVKVPTFHRSCGPGFCKPLPCFWIS